MRTSTLLTATLLVAAGAALGAIAQERVKAKGLADFGSIHSGIKKDFDAGKFGKAYKGTQDLLGVIGNRRATAIREALPAAPADHEKVPFKEPKNMARQNAMLSAMGNMIEQIYNGPNGRIKVSVMADSPYGQMFSMAVTNPAMLQDNQELVKYGDISAIFETNGDRKNLKILIENSLIEVEFPKHTDDFVFAMWNQAAVDKVKAAISN